MQTLPLYMLMLVRCKEQKQSWCEQNGGSHGKDVSKAQGQIQARERTGTGRGNAIGIGGNIPSLALVSGPHGRKQLLYTPLFFQQQPFAEPSNLVWPGVHPWSHPPGPGSRTTQHSQGCQGRTLSRVQQDRTGPSSQYRRVSRKPTTQPLYKTMHVWPWSNSASRQL